MAHSGIINIESWRPSFQQVGIAVSVFAVVVVTATAVSPVVPTVVMDNDFLFHLLAWAVLTAVFLMTRAPILRLGVVLTAFSLLLEMLQAAVPHREFAISDIVANQIGIMAGLVAIGLYRGGRTRNDALSAGTQPAPGGVIPLPTASPRPETRLHGSKPDAGEFTWAEHPSFSGVIRLLLLVSIFASSFVFVEPSPYEGLVIMLAVFVLAATRTLHRSMLLLLTLLFLWAVGAAAVILPAGHDPDALRALATSAYLFFTAFVFALAFSNAVLLRLATLRNAYIFSAVLTALIGTAGYFGAIPGSEILLENGRVRGTFKDPNVFGPYLILPMLLIIGSFLRGRLRVSHMVALPILLTGLLLSFSRGAWGHFLLSFIIMVGLVFATETSAKRRFNILVGVPIAGLVIAGLSLALLSMDKVGDMFEQRAALVQPYDTGPGGRFTAQAVAIGKIIEHPLGMGPLQFQKELLKNASAAPAPHNAYINAMLSYGWTGGFAFAVLIWATVAIGFSAVVQRTPWRDFLIPCYATFLGLAAESMIIDTNHWRHLYLLIGIIWGLVAATARLRATTRIISVSDNQTT